MSIDLQDLFDQAGRHAPASSLDGDLIVRRGRRIRARRRTVASTGALVGAGVVAFGSVALAGILPGGGRAPAVMGPAASGPAVTYDASASVPTTSGSADPSNQPGPPAGLANVSLPDPAPGFPIRRSEDEIAHLTSGPDGRNYWVNTYLLGEQPPTVTTDAAGNETGGSPNGPEVTVIVGDIPAATVRSDGTIGGHEVVASPMVAGVTGHVTTHTEKGTPQRALYFSGEFNVQVIGSGGVTTRQLVDLGNAITGLH